MPPQDRGGAAVCQAAYQPAEEHYNQTLDYIEQVRIIKHDFRHHIHALLNMDRGERTNYLMNLKRELDMTAEMVFCQNQAVNGLLQGVCLQGKAGWVEFTARWI